MTRTIYATATSLDGFLADPDGRIDWLLRFGEPEEGYFARTFGGMGAVAMGSTTYRWMIGPEGGAGAPGAWPYAYPTWVFSSRQDLPAPEGADVRFVRGDVRPVHAAMLGAAGERDVWIVGGGDLAGQFYDAGLLDELLVTVTPVTLGGGAPLFPRRVTERPLRLVEARQVGPHFVDLRYEVPR